MLQAALNVFATAGSVVTENAGMLQSHMQQQEQLEWCARASSGPRTGHTL
jgi:hypothetical protein